MRAELVQFVWWQLYTSKWKGNIVKYPPHWGWKKNHQIYSIYETNNNDVVNWNVLCLFFVSHWFFFFHWWVIESANNPFESVHQNRWFSHRKFILFNHKTSIYSRGLITMCQKYCIFAHCFFFRLFIYLLAGFSIQQAQGNIAWCD